MAKINPYDTQTVGPQGILGGRRADAADFASEASGLGLRQFGAGVESLAKDTYALKVQDDVTSVHTQMSKAQLDWQNTLAERIKTAKPGDQTIVPTIQKEMGEYFQQMRETVGTREGAALFDKQAAELTTHFAGKAIVGQAQLDGLKAVQDFKDLTNNLSNTVMSDPTSYDKLKAQLKAALDDPNSTYAKVPGADRIKLLASGEADLARGQVNGLIKNGLPDLARKKLMDGEYDNVIDERTKNALITSSEVGIRGQEAQAKHAEAAAKKEEKDRIDAANHKLNDLFMAGKLSWGAVKAANLPSNGEGSEDHWIGRIKQQAKDMREAPARTTPSVFNSLRERMDLPPGDPRKIKSADEVWAFYGKGLSEADAGRLERRFQDNRSESGQKWSQAESEIIKNLRPQLDKSTMNKIDTGGGDRVQAFTTFLRDKKEEYAKAGKDPYDLLRPDKPDYVGKAIPAFQTGAQAQQRALSVTIDNAMGKGKPRPSLDDIFNKKAP